MYVQVYAVHCEGPRRKYRDDRGAMAVRLLHILEELLPSPRRGVYMF